MSRVFDDLESTGFEPVRGTFRLVSAGEGLADALDVPATTRFTFDMRRGLRHDARAHRARQRRDRALGRYVVLAGAIRHPAHHRARLRTIVVRRRVLPVSSAAAWRDIASGQPRRTFSKFRPP